MSKPVVSYKIFIASPRGLAEERRRFQEVVNAYSDGESYERGIIYKAVGWEDTLSQVGRPQNIINQDIEECDYFVLVLHDVWGSPPDKDGRYSSGTEEEFHLAIELFNDSKKPLRQIVMLFKDVAPGQMADPGHQLAQVLAFRREREDKKDFLYKTFDTIDNFEKILRNHLSKWTLHADKVKRTEEQVAYVTTNFESKDENWLDEIIIHDNWDLASKRADTLILEGKILEADLIYSQIYRRSNDPMLIAKYGYYMREQYKFNAAQEALNKSIDISRDTKNVRCLAYAKWQLGRIQEDKGQFERALIEYEEAYRGYIDSNDEQGQANVLLSMGFSLGKSNKTELAIEKVSKAKDLFQKIRDNTGIVSCYGYLGIIYKDSGDLIQGEEYQIKAIKQVKEAVNLDSHALAITLGNLGVIRRLQKNYSEAESLHKEALGIYENGNDTRAIAREYSNLGVVYRKTDRLDDALVMHEKALEFEVSSLNEKGKGIQLSNMGLIYLEWNDLDRAEVFLNEALNISKKLNDKKSLSIQYKNFSRLNFQKGDLNKALYYLDKAVAIDLDFKNKFGIAESKRMRGNFLGSSNRIEEAIRSYSEANEIYSEQNLHHYVHEINLALEELQRTG